MLAKPRFSNPPMGYSKSKRSTQRLNSAQRNIAKAKGKQELLPSAFIKNAKHSSPRSKFDGKAKSLKPTSHTIQLTNNYQRDQNDGISNRRRQLLKVKPGKKQSAYGIEDTRDFEDEETPKMIYK